jgi:hypothetical protein
MEAMRLRKLFEFVGDHFGIAVEAITTDGRQPIGRGIGPVLDAQDVRLFWPTILLHQRTFARSRYGLPRVFLVHGEEPTIAGLSTRIAERIIQQQSSFCLC